MITLLENFSYIFTTEAVVSLMNDGHQFLEQ